MNESQKIAERVAKEAKLGDLLIRKDGRPYYVVRNKDNVISALSVNMKKEFYLCQIYLFSQLSGKQAQSEIVSFYNHLSHEDVFSIVEMRIQKEGCLENLMANEFSESNYTKKKDEVIADDILPGLKGELRQGRFFMDRFRAFRFIYSSNHEGFKSIALKYTMSGSPKFCEHYYSEFRENLKHSFARKGVAMIFDVSDQEKVTEVNFLLGVSNGNTPNVNLNQVRKSVIADLRTKKDLADYKLPIYNHKIWFASDDGVVYGERTLESIKKRNSEPSRTEEEQIMSLLRKHPEFIKKLLIEGDELTVYQQALEKKHFNAIEIAENLEFDSEYVNNILVSLHRKRYIELKFKKKKYHRYRTKV